MNPTEMIAGYAAAVATITAAWSIYVALRDRAQLSVFFSRSDYMIGGPAPIIVPHLVGVTAANAGRRPITISRYYFALNNGHELFGPPCPAWPLPKRLEEAEAYTNFFTLRSIQDEVQKYPPDVRLTALVFATVDGRKFRRKIGRRDVWQKIVRGELVPQPDNLYILDPLQVAARRGLD